MIISFSRLDTNITQGSKIVTQATETLPGDSKTPETTQIPLYGDSPTGIILAASVLIGAVAGLVKVLIKNSR